MVFIAYSLKQDSYKRKLEAIKQRWNEEAWIRGASFPSYKGPREKPYLKPLFTLFKSFLTKEIIPFKSSYSFFSFSFSSYLNRLDNPFFPTVRILREKPFLKPLFALFKSPLNRELSLSKPILSSYLLRLREVFLSYKKPKD
jgi:hypothetical protein